MIGAVVTLAILLLQLYLGVVPTSMTASALKSFGWPYLAVIAFFLAGALLKAPVELDNQRTSQMLGSTEALQRQQEENRVLHDRLAAPQISPLEQGRRNLVADNLKDATRHDIEFLTHVLHHGQVDDTAFIRDAPQDEQKLYRDAVNKALGSNLLIYGPHYGGASKQRVIINPDLIDALSFHLLRPDEASGSESSQTYRKGE